MTKKALLALCALAAACGGGDKLDPSKVTFTYPAGSPVLSGTGESAAASVGETGVQDARALPSESDPTAADARATSVVTMPEAVADACMGSSTTMALAALAPAQARLEKRIASAARADVAAAVAGFDDPSCVTVVPGQITYRGCRETQVDPSTGETVTSTVDGTLTVTVAVGTATATWDIRIGVAAAQDALTMNVGSHAYGTYTVTASTLAGHSQNDVTMTVSMPQMSVRAGVTMLGDYDLDFVTDPFCVTGGTLEVRRIWTERPPMGDPAEMQDVGVKFTWEGCGIVNVAWGTRN